MSSSKNTAARATLSVTLIIFLSKAAGLIRDAIVAGAFSTGWQHDAYSSAYTLFYFPVLLFNSCITSTLIPLYVDARTKKGLRTADRFASNCIGVFAVFSLVVGVVMLFLAEPLTRLIFSGYNEETRLLTAHLTRIMMPSLVFVVVSIVMTAILNTNERYTSAQLTGFPLSFAMIVATVFFAPAHGIQAVAWGVFAAGVLQMLILVPSVSRTINYRPSLRVGDERVKRILYLALPAMLSMAVNELNHMVDKSLASALPVGSVSAMDYAYRLITFALGVLAVPLTTIMFSRLSEHAAAGNRRALTESLSHSIETLTLILLPFVVAGSVLSTDIIRLLYEHNNFGADAVQVTSGVLFMYMLGLIGFALRDMYNRAFHAMQDTRTPLLASVFTVALNIALNVILSRRIGVNGLALATTISCAVGALVLMVLLRRKVGRLGMRRTGAQLGKMLLGAVPCFILSVTLDRWIPTAYGKVMIFLRLVAIVGLSFGAYFAVLILLKVRGLSFFKGIFRRRKAT